jgi:hypothetical protein
MVGYVSFAGTDLVLAVQLYRPEPTEGSLPPPPH